MSLFLTILAVLAIIILALEVRRRIRKASGRLGRSRNAAPIRTSAGLSFDRQIPRSAARKKSGRVSHIAGPVVVGLVFIFMGAWLAFSYFMPDAETTAAVLPPTQIAPPPVQTTKALGGRIVAQDKPGASPAQPAMSSGAAAVLNTNSQPPKPTVVTDAARSMISTYSQMGQVGLLPAQVKARPAAAAKTSEPAAQAKAAQPKTAQAQAGASKPKRPAEASTPKRPAKTQPDKPEPQQQQAAAPKKPATVAAASSSLVNAASGATGGLAKPVSAELEETLLGGGRAFTVHLSSFRELDNAERYEAELTARGEKAIITEATVNGQQWYRVMIDRRFKSRTEAESYGRDLKRRGLTADAGQYFVKPVD